MSDPAPTQDEPRPQAGGPNAFTAVLRDEVVRQNLLVTALAVVTALAIGAFLIVLSDDATRGTLGYVTARPGDFLDSAWDILSGAYSALFQGALGGPGAWSETIVAATPLVFTGLAFALPFRALIINIGGEGQFIAGALLGGLVGFTVTGLPLVVHLPLTLLAGFAGGALYGFVPGILKARTGAHEVITTIMLNNVGGLLTFYLLSTTLYQRQDSANPQSKPMLDSATLPDLLGSSFRAHTGFLVALLAAFAIWWLLERSTFGFEVKAVGHNPRAARFAGMNPDRTYWIVMSLAGALAGLGGVVQLSGISDRINPGFSAGLGFDGITVALLGRARPGGTVAAALLIGGLKAGGLGMQGATGTSLDLVTVIQALIVIFIAAPALIRALYRVRTPEPALEATAAGGWQ